MMTISPQYVKICGIRELEHAQTAAMAGADFIGMIFAPGKRQIQPEHAQSIVAGVKSDARPRWVGVFVNSSAEVITQVAQQVGLDSIQLSGTEPIELADQLNYPIFKAIRLLNTDQEQAWIELAQREPNRIFLVLDAHVAGSFGGAGVVGDWQQAALLAQKQPILLAGGLHPENVHEAITTVQPAGVDVSSGVETTGVKDHSKIEAFIRTARTAWATYANFKEEV